MNGLDAVGLFTLQVTDEIWPATAGINLQQPTISQAIERSTFFDIEAEQAEAERLVELERKALEEKKIQREKTIAAEAKKAAAKKATDNKISSAAQKK